MHGMYQAQGTQAVVVNGKVLLTNSTSEMAWMMLLPKLPVIIS